MNQRRLLLISNSTLHGSGFLDHTEAEIRDFLGPVARVLFVPFALHDQNAYATRARERFAAIGYGLDSLHEPIELADKQRAVYEAEAIFIGGGNTFRLLKALYDFDLLSAIRQRVGRGMPYIGSSAGSNVAAPTIRTTNDMPIVEPPSLNSLGLVTFQINPHYLDTDPNSTHMGETREERLIQFLEDNETPVVALREGAMLRVEQASTILKGSSGARLFRKGQKAIEVTPGSIINELVSL